MLTRFRYAQTREQRYVIYLELQRGTSQEVIAQLIDVSKSTVCREIKRNSTKNGKYVWFKAHDKADEPKKRNPGNRCLSSVLRWRIKQFIIEEQWSPRQISGYLAKEGIKVSHESIYAIIRNDESGELAKHCRHRMKYKRVASRRHVTKATNIKNRVSIHERPVEANGKRFGDWEMDLIVDKASNAILVLMGRSTSFTLMEKLKHGKKANRLQKQSDACYCHIKERCLKQSPQIMEASLPSTNGLQSSLMYLSILQILIVRGRKAEWRMRINLLGNTYQKEQTLAL